MIKTIRYDTESKWKKICGVLKTPNSQQPEIVTEFLVVVDYKLEKVDSATCSSTQAMLDKIDEVNQSNRIKDPIEVPRYDMNMYLPLIIDKNLQNFVLYYILDSKFHYIIVQCPILEEIELASSKCGESANAIQKPWNIPGWNEGKNCQHQCNEQIDKIGYGCCEAKLQSTNKEPFNSTLCVYRDTQNIIIRSKYSKAVLCKGKL